VGQTHELHVLLPPDAGEALARLPVLLRDAHLTEFGHAPDAAARVEVVNLRVACLGSLERPDLPTISPAPPPVPAERRGVVFDRERLRTPVYEREALGRGARLEGPALIEQVDSTTLLPPGWTATVDALGNLALEAIA